MELKNSFHPLMSLYCVALRTTHVFVVMLVYISLLCCHLDKSVAHAYNHSTQEAEAGQDLSLSLKPAWAT
jgi:hypothetical protein